MIRADDEDSERLSLPLVPHREDAPYAASWAAVLLFGGYSAAMLLALLKTVSVELMSGFVGVLQTALAWLAYSVLFVALSVTLQVPGWGERQTPYSDGVYEDVVEKGVPALMIPAYFIVYLSSLLVLGQGVGLLEALNSPLTIVAAVEALILGVLFVNLTRPLRPTVPAGVDDEVAFLEQYFSMWWRSMRLVVAILLSVSVGVAITTFLSDQTNGLQLASLSIHMVLALLPGTFIVAYMFMKSRVVLKLMSERL